MHLPPPLPATQEEIAAALTLTHFAAVTGVQRHAGRLAHLTRRPAGRRSRAGAISPPVGSSSAPAAPSRVCPAARPCSADARAKSGGGERLLPPPDARVALDRDYIFACCGALFAHFASDAVVALMRRSAGV